MSAAWSNWSGTVECAPARVERPRDESELRALVRAAAADGAQVRVAGSGHSHPPLVATDGVLVRLDAMSGIASCDPEAREARVRAGTVLHDLSEPLRERGLAMENLGDVDVQALAGALATGTHGTGRNLGNLSSRVTSLRLVTAAGESVECSAAERPALFEAARVSLGALGVVTEVGLSLLPAYRLHERTWREEVDVCPERLEDRIAGHRHFEFFWLPHKDRIECKTLDATNEPPNDLPDRPYERIGHSAAILPSVREERFVEMEYAVPAADGPACFMAVRDLLRRHHPDVLWPVEYRTVAADDIPLSPAHGRDTVTLSVHQGAGLPFEAAFADAESILRDARGRPHWGKWHRLRAEELSALYPHWEDFLAVRRELDPEGRFLTPYLRGLFGADAA